jgi:hypothetical protein
VIAHSSPLIASLRQPNKIVMGVYAPAYSAGFALSHSPDDCCHQLKPDKSGAEKTVRFNLLTTHGLLRT